MIFARQLASGKRPLDVRKIQIVSVPGEGSADLSRLERAEEVRPSDLECPSGRTIGGDIRADVCLIKADDRAVFCIEKDDASATKPHVLQLGS